MTEDLGLPPAFDGYTFTEVDKRILRMTDEEYYLLTWDDIKELIEKNELDGLTRRPSDLRRYLAWSAETKSSYGTVLNYIAAERLPKSWGMPPYTSKSPVPLESPADHVVLVNDWPYGTAPGIVHIVVWMRVPLPKDEEGELTDEGRRLIGNFVERFFLPDLGEDAREKVVWFKNWPSRQSVKALEHFHLFVRDAGKETLAKWVGEKDWHKE